MRTGVLWMEDGMGTRSLCCVEGKGPNIVFSLPFGKPSRLCLWIGTNTRYSDAPITPLSAVIGAKGT